MPSLEEVIRDAAKRGDLTHLSVALAPDGKRWQASYAPARQWHNSIALHADPAEALKRAILEFKPRKRAKEKPETATDEDFG